MICVHIVNMWGYSPSSFRWLRVLFWICNKLHKNKRNKMNTNSKRMSQLCMHASWSTYCTRLLGNLVLITKCGYNEYFKIWCDAVFFWWVCLMNSTKHDGQIVFFKGHSNYKFSRAAFRDCIYTYRYSDNYIAASLHKDFIFFR